MLIMVFVSSILIFLDIGFFSVSFVFGILLILVSLKSNLRLLLPKGVIWFLVGFLVVAFLSILFSEINLSFRTGKVYIQTIYWFFLAAIVYNSYQFLNKRVLSKFVLFSSFILLWLYVIGFRYGMTQNSVAFSVIVFSPLGYYYLKGVWTKLGFGFLVIVLILFNGSRTGAIISTIQFGLILLFVVPGFVKYFKFAIIVIVVTLTLFNTDSIRKFTGKLIYPVNAEMSELLINYEYVMRNDKSWLIRKAQIQKGKQIFSEHPFLGIGYANFISYDINIDQSQIEADRYLADRSIKNRSAHNSYVALLSETGLLGFLLFAMFLIFIFRSFWLNFSNMKYSFERYVLVSFIGMIIYFYTVSSFMGTSSWIMYGLYAGASKIIFFKQ